MLKINLLSKLTFIGCIYIIVALYFIDGESSFIANPKQTLNRKSYARKKKSILLENHIKPEDTAMMPQKEISSPMPGSDLIDIKIQPRKISHIPIFTDSGAAL
ncbi:hypothetical protein ABH942_000949 [Flavobacterium sp. 28YEA47A]|uniref:hypothetical protein n=1 Tax=Flavobacterium sp. 28YEA47A TaxID=3156276 RepID=UPI003513DF4F